MTRISAILLFLGIIFTSSQVPIPHVIQADLMAGPQNIELHGMISTIESGGRKIPHIRLADGRDYVIVGKLEKLIRDQYNGRSIRVSGRIEQEAVVGKAGIFHVEEIAVQLN